MERKRQTRTSPQSESIGPNSPLTPCSPPCLSASIYLSLPDGSSASRPLVIEVRTLERDRLHFTFRNLLGPDLPPLQPAPDPIRNFDSSRIDGVLGVIPISVKLKDRVAADTVHIVESPNAEVLRLPSSLGVFSLLRPLGIKQ